MKKLKHEIGRVKEEVEKADKESQVEITVCNNGTQTELQCISVGVNTENQKVTTFKDEDDTVEKGVMFPKNNEILVEMRFGHSFKSWPDIEEHIRHNFKMTLFGQPWICNNGKHFMTIGFRTIKKDFEAWKGRTLHWKDSGTREVASSRLYK